MLEDVEAGRLTTRERDGTLERVLAERGVEWVTHAGWQSIDADERERGTPLGRPRVKLLTRDELLASARRTPNAET